MLQANGRESSPTVEIKLEDLLWVTGLSRGLLSTGTIGRQGGEFVNPDSRRNYIAFK